MNQFNEPNNILLIEDEEDHAEILKRFIFERFSNDLSFIWVDELEIGLKKIEQIKIDIILLDLGLPGNSKENIVTSVLNKALDIPIVIISGMTDEEFALEVVNKGVQDYICKGQINSDSLFRSIRYSIERKKTEMQLRNLNKSKDDFLSTLSHELRSPVALIQNYAELLIHNKNNLNNKNYVIEGIYKQAKHQLNLVDDLLDMTRIINGKIDLKNEVVNLIRVLEDSIESQKASINSKMISIKMNSLEEQIYVMGDFHRLEQVFVNILSNAIKFSSFGSEIDINLEIEKSFSKVTVRDYGQGIESEFLPYVFDRFKQQEGSINRKFGGLGLGMAITKQLIDLQDGQIFVKSEGAGKGSEFSVLLNLANPQAYYVEKNLLKVKEDNLKKISKNCLKGIKVLTIDDSTEVLFILECMLTSYGATVFQAETAKDGIQKINFYSPDLIICDIGLPELDGNSFIKKVKHLQKTNELKLIPAIALTAYAKTEDKERSLKSGFDKYLTKPIYEKELIESVLSLICSNNSNFSL